ncbi:hypothetical protein FXO37_28161 [Capsicum annuum]|nr:hypothetical protein FXO37_28161 [Capsicum annuum]
MFYERTKHIDVRYHFVHEIIGHSGIMVSKISAHDNPADMMTKTLPRIDPIGPIPESITDPVGGVGENPPRHRSILPRLKDWESISKDIGIGRLMERKILINLNEHVHSSASSSHQGCSFDMSSNSQSNILAENSEHVNRYQGMVYDAADIELDHHVEPTVEESPNMGADKFYKILNSTQRTLMARM